MPGSRTHHSALATRDAPISISPPGAQSLHAAGPGVTTNHSPGRTVPDARGDETRVRSTLRPHGAGHGAWVRGVHACRVRNIHSTSLGTQGYTHSTSNASNSSHSAYHTSTLPCSASRFAPSSVSASISLPAATISLSSCSICASASPIDASSFAIFFGAAARCFCCLRSSSRRALASAALSVAPSDALPSSAPTSAFRTPRSASEKSSSRLPGRGDASVSPLDASSGGVRIPHSGGKRGGRGGWYCSQITLKRVQMERLR